MLNNLLNRRSPTPQPPKPELTVEQKAQKFITEAVGDKETLSEKDFNNLFDHLKSWMTKAEEKGTSSSERKSFVEAVNGEIANKFLIVHQQRGDQAAFKQNLNNYEQGLTNFLNEQINKQSEKYEKTSGADILISHGFDQNLTDHTLSELNNQKSQLVVANNQTEYTIPEQKQIFDKILATARASVNSEDSNFETFSETLSQGLMENKDKISQESLKIFMSEIQASKSTIATSSLMVNHDDSKLLAIANTDDKDVAISRIGRLEARYQKSVDELKASSNSEHEFNQTMEDIQAKSKQLSKNITNIKGENQEETQEKVQNYIDSIEIYDNINGTEVLNEEKTKALQNNLKLSASKALKAKETKKASKENLQLGNMVGHLLGGFALMTIFGGLFKGNNKYLNANNMTSGRNKLLKSVLMVTSLGVLAKETGIFGKKGKEMMDDFIETASSKTAGKKAPPAKVKA
ncbi:MAG: hypothetical protein HRT47_07750 [Candidatus Caenarcaniphilales bacterium]|nr:hypothetical protein [Candidatus Caenarcaniphilales bacterium]